MKNVHLNERITHELFYDGFSDTRTYRYWVFDTVDGCIIKRIRQEYLDTTAALSAASDSNPNGWEVLPPGRVRLTK